tara:strand:+ start:10315 stop:10788 length:474 start_codon:yes stop_codon:yes gene_type:complete
MIDEKTLIKYAVNYLSKYTSSKKNLENILKKKIRRITDDKKNRFKLYNDLNFIIEKLEKNNIINDENYTNSKIRYLINQGKSKIFIKRYLIQKGINTKLANTQILQFYNLDNNIELENAKKFAIKKNLMNDKIDFEKKLSKMARAGFSYEISKQVLK